MNKFLKFNIEYLKPPLNILHIKDPKSSINILAIIIKVQNCHLIKFHELILQFKLK